MSEHPTTCAFGVRTSPVSVSTVLGERLRVGESLPGASRLSCFRRRATRRVHALDAGTRTSKVFSYRPHGLKAIKLHFCSNQPRPWLMKGADQTPRMLSASYIVLATDKVGSTWACRRTDKLLGDHVLLRRVIFTLVFIAILRHHFCRSSDPILRRRWNSRLRTPGQSCNSNPLRPGDPVTLCCKCPEMRYLAHFTSARFSKVCSSEP